MNQRTPSGAGRIDQRAREAARAAARDEGLTLGDYLRRLLTEEKTVDAPEPTEAPDSGAAAASALDRLTRRIETAEARSTLAITGIDQSILGLVARLENTEQGQDALNAHVDGVIEDVLSTHEALKDKVRRLEEDESNARNLEALKSLEQALGKLASHVYEENALAQDEAIAIKARIETGLDDLSGKVEGMEAKVETTLSDAAKRVEQAVEKAELRAEGAARHLAERMGVLENDVAGRLDAVDTFETRVGTVESDVSDALASMEGTLLRMQERLHRAENTTDAALKGLETTFDSLDKRIETVARHASPEAADELRRQFEQRFAGLADDLRHSIDAARKQLADEIESASQAANPALVEKFEVSLAEMGRRLSQTEERQARAIETVGEQMNRISRGFDQRLVSMESRNDTSAAEAVREEVARLSETVDHRLDEIESREANAIQKVGEEMGRLADQLDERVVESERRSAAAIEQVGEQVAGVATRLQNRQDAALKSISEKLDTVAGRQDARLSEALSNVSERLETIQAQTTISVSPVQKAITSLAQRIEALEDFTSPPYADVPADAPLPHRNAAELSAPKPASMTPPPTEPAPIEEEPSGDEEFQVGLDGWGDIVRAAQEIDTSPGGFTDDDPTEGLQPLETTPTDETPTDPADPLAALESWDQIAAEDAAELFEEVDLADVETAEAAPLEPHGDDDASTDAPSLENDGAPNAADEDDSATIDYLTRARRAAQAAALAAGTNSKDGKKTASAARSTGERGRSRAPMIAAVAAIGVVSASAAGYLHLRGKQPGAPVVSTEPPELASVDSERETAPVLAGVATRDLAESVSTDPADTIAEEDASPALRAQSSTDDAAEFPTDLQPRLDAVAPETPIPPLVTLEQAAERGNPIAQFELGEARLAAEDYAVAANLIRAAAEAGLPAAQYRMAKLHEKGLGVARDLTEARRWTEQAARGGNSKAMHDLAVYFAEGEGGPQSYAGAVEWFRKAAEFGVVDSQYNLGVLYEQGLGISPSLTEALFWFEAAAAAGDPGAPIKIEDLRERVSFEAAQQTSRRAETWEPAALDAGANGDFGPQPWQQPPVQQVEAVQETLNALGYNAGTADGALGAKTRSAIRAFERDLLLEETGEISQPLIDNLNVRAGFADN